MTPEERLQQIIDESLEHAASYELWAEILRERLALRADQRRVYEGLTKPYLESMLRDSEP